MTHLFGHIGRKCHHLGGSVTGAKSLFSFDFARKCHHVSPGGGDTYSAMIPRGCP